MSLWPTVSFILWLLGAAAAWIEFEPTKSDTWAERAVLAALCTCWPAVICWALVQWARGK